MFQHFLKVKAKVGRRARVKRDAAMFVPLDAAGKFHHTQDQFVNEMEVDGETAQDGDQDVSRCVAMIVNQAVSPGSSIKK